MELESPYEVLGVEPDADQVEIVQAYRERVKQAHPDQGGSASEFRRVKAAYEQIQTGTAAEYEQPQEPPGTTRTTVTESRDDTEPSGDDTEAKAEQSSEEQTARVEYLNYDVLADQGWDLGDEDLFEKASDANLDPVDYGQILVEPGESLLEAAENRGFMWPYACRGGACANCAIAVLDGETSMPSNHILSADMLERGIRLSCISAPVTDDLQVIYNVKHLPGLDELRLPASRFEQARSTE